MVSAVSLCPGAEAVKPRLGRDRDHGVAVAGGIEVGVDLPQSRELKPCPQLADREGTERDLVFVWLNPAAVLEDEHQMGDVLVAEAVRHLPGIEHQASPPPAGDHLVVVSHRPKPAGWHPEASCHFADDVTAAIGKAQELAGERTVAVNAGEVGSQILAAGLVDEVAMDVVPVVFGSGKRYFGSIDGQHLLEDPHVVIQGDRVLHLRFRVRR